MIQPLRLNIPEQIETPRLLLRNPRAEDGVVIAETIRSSLTELKRWMPWATDAYGPADAQDWCRRAAARGLIREDASYLIFHRETSRHIGTISSWSKNWDIPKFEIGYWLATHATGNGYMSEALRAVTQMTFDDFGARRIEIRTDARNLPSRRVAERAGYVLEGILRNDCRDNRGELNDECIYASVR